MTPRPPRDAGSSRGQASVEWVAVLLLVAVVLGAAAVGVVPGAGAIPRAVAATYARAFCLVSGGDCLAGAPRPCVVASTDRSHERRVSLALLRLGDGRHVLREERSDGTVVITVEDTKGGGIGLVAGLQLGGGVKASLEGSADVRGGRGRSFVVRDRAAAEALLERLEDDDGPPPDERWSVFGKGGRLEAGLSLKRLGASARGVTGTVAGVREREATGERTLILRNDGALAAALTAPMSRLLMGLPGSTSIELGLDRSGRPASLVVRAARGVHGEARLGPLRSGGGDLVEAEARLDLADPIARALASDLLHPTRTLGAARALAARLADRARVDVRLYETDESSSVKEHEVALGVKVGLETEERTRTARLVDAAGREPGLGWARRLDCVGVA
jgi:hypothetical protein